MGNILKYAFVIASIAMTLMVPCSVWAQVDLPPSETISDLVQRLKLSPAEFTALLESGEAQAARCEVTGGRQLSCHCVGFEGVRVREMSWLPSGAVQADGVRLTQDGAELVVERVEVGERLEMWLGVIHGRSESALGFRRASGSRTRMQFDEVGVGRVGQHGDVCSGPVQVQIESPWTAKSAVVESANWSFQQVETGALAQKELNSATGRDGFLPPNFYVAEDVVELETGYYWDLLGAIPYVTIAPLNAYGLGVAKVTQNEGRTHLVRADARWDHDDGPSAYVGGEFDVGAAGRSRTSGRIEHPSTETSRRARQTERGSEFRDVRITELGFGFSGPVQFLGLRAGAVTHPDRDTAWLAGFRYGQDVQLAEHLELGVDVAQQSLFEGDRRSHETGVGVRAGFPFGSAGRMKLTPDITAAMNFGVLPEDLGFEASTTGSLQAGLQAEMSISGRFAGFEHRVQPLIRFDREVYGFTQRPVLPPSSPGFGFDRVPDWTSIWAGVRQELVFPSLTVGLPIGAWLADDGVSGLLDAPHLQASLILDGERWGAMGAASWRDGCTAEACADLGWRASLWVALDSWQLYGVSAQQSASWARAETSLARSNAGLSGWRTSQGRLSSQGNTGKRGHRLGLDGGFWVLQTGLEAVWDEESTRGQGLSGRLSYPLAGLGWQLTSQGSVTKSGDWNVMVGWELARN